MDKKIIESYITFGIDNGFLENLAGKYDKIITIDIGEKQTYISLQERPGFTMSETFNNIELFTKKQFIEAISRGFNKKIGLGEPRQEHFEELCKTQALFIAGYGGKETFEDFILEIIK